ncbi:hypothetical protein [Vibrio coralliilyticus]|uniref:hypothetical protein n=1 Tax=Vibrio coralliilyticus TaxID=190893 RepID=UPI0017A6CDC9|nr:hypothetical protein [Vibrio coralliilyticus]NUW67114.1 hypothetical protein [Vibrio coralliilyticus]
MGLYLPTPMMSKVQRAASRKAVSNLTLAMPMTWNRFIRRDTLQQSPPITDEQKQHWAINEMWASERLAEEEYSHLKPCIVERYHELHM